MKFSNKAGCKVATREDVLLAERQNGLVSFEGDGKNYGKEGFVIEKQEESSAHDSSLLLISSIVFSLLGLAMFVVTSIMKLNQKEDLPGDPKEPSGFVINSILKSMSKSEKSSSLLSEPTSEQSWLQRRMVSFSPSKECEKDIKTQEDSADRSTKTSNSSLSVILLGSTLYKKLSASFAYNKTAPEVEIVPKSAGTPYVPPAADSPMDISPKVEDSLEQVSQVPATSSSNVEASITPSQSIPAAASLVPAVDDAALISETEGSYAPAIVGGDFVEVTSEPPAVVNHNSGGIPIGEDYAEINADELLSKKSKRSRSSSRSRLSKFFHR